ncbi:MAG: tetratricopeptide repeat protein [Candidatus Peribacteraceae bacterium]
MTFRPPSSHPSSLEQAEHLRRSGRHTEAIDVLSKVLTQSPDDIHALEELADNELNLEHFDRAETAALHVLSLMPTSAVALYILGAVYAHRERFGDAVLHFRNANALAPNTPEILRALGFALFQSGAETAGIATLERALSLEPANPLILCDLGVAHLSQGQTERARTLLSEALSIDAVSECAKECADMLQRIEQNRS